MALSVAATTTIFVFVSMQRGPLMWDESVFIYKAFGVSEGLRHLNLGAAWTAVATGDLLYPPVSSFAMGSMFAIFGSSQTVALACTAVGFVASAALLFKIGCLLDEKQGHIVGLIASLLFLGSPLLMEYAGTNMLEVPGTLTTLLAIWAYLWHLRRGTEMTALATGLALALTFFTKYNYGLFAIAAVGVCQLTIRQWQPWRRENLWLWVPVVALGYLWFTMEGKWNGFVAFATNASSGLSLAESLLYYPRVFFTEYSSSILLGIVVILSGLGALKWIKEPNVRFLLIFFAIGFGAMAKHPLKADRYIATVVPMLFLVAAFTLAQGYDRLTSTGWRRVAAALGVLMFLPSALLYADGVPRLVTRNRPAWSSFPWPYRALYKAVDMVLADIDPKVPTTFTGMINQWSPEYIRWRFEMAHPGSRLYFDHLEMGRCNFVSMELLPGSPYLTAEYFTYNAKRVKEARDRLVPRVQAGVRREGIFLPEGIKVVIVKDAVVTPQRSAKDPIR